MKLAKKLMVAAAALAAFGLMGCDPRLGDHGIIDANTSGAEVNYTSEEDFTIRELVRTNFKHSGGIWTITQKVNNDDLTGSGINEKGEGLMGVVFDMEQNDDKTWNFLVVGVGRNNKHTLSYVSYFVNIDEAQLDASNFGCPEENKKNNIAELITAKGNGTPYEYVASGLQTDLLPDNLYNSETKELSVKIAVVPSRSKQDTNMNEYLGGYRVLFYRPSADLYFDDMKDLCVRENSQSPITECAVPGVFNPTKAMGAGNVKNPDKLPQNYIGYYCNVYPKQTMTGTWSLPNKAILNEAIEE